ncbi:hypothetical protein DY000_02060358 [Brassica cretica]|uniref:TPX2 C-terminal domain-containing protein n=1 Tax=Brassica cretica TaxID=69181 RepID=A0ABQ7AZA4_BRACR|nr:hypothetical protein DY000_02060358 [Brassica cretica]
MIPNHHLTNDHLCKTVCDLAIFHPHTHYQKTHFRTIPLEHNLKICRQFKVKKKGIKQKMSLASPIQCIRIINPSSLTTSSSLRFSTSNPCVFIIRCSQAEGPLRRPSAPPTLREPSPPQKPVLPMPSSSPPPPQKAVAVDGKSVVTTVEFQRQKAKELQDYFKQKKLEAAGQGPFFGFQPKNEISNGSSGLS